MPTVSTGAELATAVTIRLHGATSPFGLFEPDPAYPYGPDGELTAFLGWQITDLRSGELIALEASAVKLLTATNHDDQPSDLHRATSRMVVELLRYTDQTLSVQRQLW